MTEHIERARDLAQQIEDHHHAIGQAAAERRAALTAARQTMTVQEIADALGISRARVYAVLGGRE